MKRIVHLILFFFISQFFFSQKNIYTNDTIKSIDKYIEDFVLSNKGRNNIDKDFQNFNGINLDGSNYSSLENTKITFYNFWFTTCTPCVLELPMLNELKTKYNNKVDFIAVTFEEKKDIEVFLKKFEFNFQHVRMKKNEISSLFFTNGYPTTIIVNNGKIVYCYYGGPGDKNSKYYEPLIKKLHKEYEDVLNYNLNLE